MEGTILRARVFSMFSDGPPSVARASERRMVEAAGIEPASEDSPTTASTCVVWLLKVSR